MKQLRLLAFIILYPLAHLPWVIFLFLPLAGAFFGWGWHDAVAIWALWYLPAAFILYKKDRWQWWCRILNTVNSIPH